MCMRVVMPNELKHCGTLAEEVEKLELKTEVEGDLKRQSKKKRGEDASSTDLPQFNPVISSYPVAFLAIAAASRIVEYITRQRVKHQFRFVGIYSEVYGTVQQWQQRV